MSNHIDHIEITNFKSIRHQKIEGCKRINVFIGYPNVGKSNILEAISTLSYLQSDYNSPISDLCRLRNPSELFYDSDIKKEIRIEFHDSPSKLITKPQIGIRYLSEKNLDLVVGQPDTFSINTLGSNDKQKWTIEKNIRFSKDFERTHDNISSVELVSNKGPILQIGPEVIVKKYSFRNSYDYPDLFQDYKINGLTLLAPFGENLVDIIQFNKPLRKEVSDIFKINGLKLSIDQGNNSIKALKELDDETIFLIPFYQMADTLQRLIFHKAAIMSNENSVLLFEEPEAHMFPPYIRKFTGDIIFNKENNNQYFISTHSPIVVGDFLEDAREDLSVYLVGLKNGETIIKRLSETEVQEVYEYGVDLFFNIESYLD